MRSVRRSPRNELNTIEAHQSAPRSDPQISIRGLCNRIRHAAKDSVLNPPGGVSVLGDLAGRIDSPDAVHSEEKQQKAEKLPPGNIRAICFWSRTCTALFERAHGHSCPPSPAEHT